MMEFDVNFESPEDDAIGTLEKYIVHLAGQGCVPEAIMVTEDVFLKYRIASIKRGDGEPPKVGYRIGNVSMEVYETRDGARFACCLKCPSLAILEAFN